MDEVISSGQRPPENRCAIYCDQLTITVGSFLEKTVVLDKLNLSVPRSCIFGLIGPSGCGKTTLQRTLIGLLRPDSGVCEVFGQVPRAKGSTVPGPMVGYMPQEIALDDELTVREQLTFLGRLAGLKQGQIDAQRDQILSLMSIDEPDKKQTRFSVGQRRRISLACSLIHSPSLLLLDEPTVGSDIVLVDRIWTYLKHLRANSDITIVLTTHYLEEVTRADYFAFMSHGRVKFQGKPYEFMKSVGAITFEQAILNHYTYSRATNQRLKNHDANNVQFTHPNSPSNGLKSPPFETSKRFAENNPQLSESTNGNGNGAHESMFVNSKSVNSNEVRQLLGFLPLALLLAWRYVLRWRYVLAIPYVVLVISLYLIALFMGAFYGEPLFDLKVAYVDLNINSSKYVQMFAENLKKERIFLIPVEDEIVARSMVETTQAAAFFIVPQEFDAGLETRVASALSQSADEALQLAGRITMYQDNSHMAMSGTIERSMYEALQETMDSIVQAKNLTSNRLEFVEIKGVIERTDSPDRMIPLPISIMRLFTFFLETYSMMLFTYWMIKESREPMNERLSSLGVKRIHLVATETVMVSAALFCAFFFMLWTFVLIFNITWKGHIVYTAPLVVGAVFCGVAKAIILGSSVQSDVQCLILNIFYCSMGWSYSCVGWPFEAIMYFIQPLCYLVPALVPSDAIIRIIMYGDGPTHPTVYLGYLYMAAMMAIHVGLIYWVTRRK